ncbi:MAG: hypothetical protein V3V67_17435 [Myxococcota bacterium]
MEALHEAGLTDRVRLGVPVPPIQGAPGSPVSPLNRKLSTNPGAEENAFLPDALLRPTSLRQGRLIEVCGEISSGRTALAYRVAAGATARGELVGWIDLPNSLDPRFLMRAGVDLKGVLWVRPPELRAALRSAELLLKTGFAVVTLDLEGASRRALGKMGASVWARLLRAVRESRATALVLGSEPVAGSFATQGLHTERRQARFERGLFEGLDSRATLLRDRTGPAGQTCDFRLDHRARAR